MVLFLSELSFFSFLCSLLASSLEGGCWNSVCGELTPTHRFVLYSRPAFSGHIVYVFVSCIYCSSPVWPLWTVLTGYAIVYFQHYMVKAKSMLEYLGFGYRAMWCWLTSVDSPYLRRLDGLDQSRRSKEVEIINKMYVEHLVNLKGA